MCEITCRVAVQLNHVFDTKTAQQLRHHDAANRVYGVDGNSKIGFLDSFNINEVEVEHAVDMLACIGVVDKLVSEFVDFSESKRFRFCDGKYFLALGVV